MANELCFVELNKKMYTVQNSLDENEKYIFIPYDSSDDKTKYTKIKDKVEETREEYKLDENIHIYENSIVINDWLNEDDTIQTVLNKIGYYCSDTIGEHIYAYYNTKEPLGFKYDFDIDIPDKDTKPDSRFYSGEIFNNSINIKNNLNILLENIEIKDNVIYYLSIDDYLKLKNIEIEKSYTIEELNSLLGNYYNFLNGIIRKYWITIDDKILTSKLNIKNKILNNENKIKKVKEQISLIDKSFKSISKDEQACKYIIKLIKLSNESNEEIDTNIIKIFSDIVLSNEYSFSKLILDKYTDTYYKIFKDSINDKVDINMCKKWINDHLIMKGLFPTFLYSTNVIVFKKYITFINQYVSIIIHINGNIDLIIYNDEDELITIEILNNILKEINTFIEEFINKYTSYTNKSLKYFITDYWLSNNKLELFNSEIQFSLSSFKNNIVDIKELNTLYKNLYSYVRVQDENKDENIIKMRYKRVSNYNNLSVIESIISTLKNPKLKLSNRYIASIISDSFELTIEESEKHIKEWSELISANILDEDKNIYTMSTNEPGTEIIISITTNILRININECKSVNEYNSIILFIQSTINLYKLYLPENEDYFKTIMPFANKYKDDIKIINNLDDVSTNAIIVDSDDDYLDDLIDTVDSSKLDPKLASSADISIISPGEFNVDDWEDSSDSSVGGANQTGGTGYYLKRLKEKERDPDLLTWKKKDYPEIKTYTSSCQSSNDRLPIIVNDDELKVINESANLGSGEQSYSNIMKIGSKPDKEYNYICPKYWDKKRNISLDPNIVEDENGKLKDKYNNNNIEIRKSEYWKKATNINDFQVRPLNTLNPHGNKMPCCYYKHSIKKKIGKKVVTHFTICKEDGKCNLPDKLKLLLGQGDNFLSDKTKTSDIDLYKTGNIKQDDFYKSGFYRTGTKNRTIIECMMKMHNNEELFNTVLFTNGKHINNAEYIDYFKIYLNEHINELQTKYIKNTIKTKLTNIINKTYIKKKINEFDIYIFAKKIKKDLKYEGVDDESQIEMDKSALVDSIFRLVQDFINIRKVNIFKNEIINKINENIDIFILAADGSLFNLFKPRSYKNEMIKTYIDFLNKYKEKYSLDETINKFNVKTIDDLFEILKKSKYIYKYLFDLHISINNYIDYLKSSVYKDDLYILPIISKSFEQFANAKMIVLEFINNDIRIKLPLDINNILEEKNELLLIYKQESVYEPILFENMTKIPLSILSGKDNKYLENIIQIINNQLKQVRDIKEDIYTYDSIQTELTNKDNIHQDRVIKNVYINTHNQISHIITHNNYIIPIKKCGIKDTNKVIYDINDITLHNYEETIDYYEKLDKKYFKKAGIIVQDRKIVNILFDNHTYIPIKNDPYNINKYTDDIISNIDLFKLDRDLSYDLLLIDDDDKRKKFTDSYNYEMQLNNIFNKNLLTYIKHDKDLKDELHKIIDNDIKIKIVKREEIYKILKPKVKLITTIIKDDNKEYKKYIKSEYIDKTICTDNKLCKLPCIFKEENCLLAIKRISDISNNPMRNKFIYKFIELLLIYGVDEKTTNNIFYSLNYKIVPHELKSMTPPTEEFFTYIEFINEYLNILFNKENMYIYNNIDEKILNEELIINNSISMYESNSPVIVQNIVAQYAKINLYNSDENIDFRIIQKCMNSKIEVTEEEIKNLMNSNNLLLNLKNITNEYNIAFLYITKEFSKIKNKYELYFIINKDNINDFYTIILFDVIDDNKKYLTNVINNNKWIFTLEDLNNLEILKKYVTENKDKIIEDASLEKILNIKESVQQIKVGSKVKWIRNRKEYNGEVIKITPQSYKICCYPGKTKDEKKKALYMVNKNIVTLDQ